MIASKKCAAQTVPTDTTVLKYLYKEAASAYYLRIDTALMVKETKIKDSLLLTKDSQLKNEAQKFSVCELEKSVKDSQIANCEKELNKSKRNIFFLKIGLYFTSASTALLFALHITSAP